MLMDQAVLLRPPLPEDREFLFRLRNDVALQSALMALPRANSPRRVDEWVEGILNDPQSLFFLIVERQTDRAIGFIQLRRMDFVHGTGELGICLEEAARGKGCAIQSLRLLETHARDVFRIRKVVLQVLASNTRAVAFYEKHGYSKVGVLQGHFYHAGTYHDVWIMEHLLVGTA